PSSPPSAVSLRSRWCASTTCARTRSRGISFVPTATLHVEAGPAAGSSVAVENEPLLIGRGPGRDSVGALGGDPELSREHARISVANGAWIVEDLGSTNGTFVNGKRIGAPTELRSGDRIKVGTTNLRFEQP